MQIGPCIEGRSSNLESIVKFVCEHVPEEKEDVRVAVKNIIFQEANRKSYSHEKREFVQHLPSVLLCEGKLAACYTSFCLLHVLQRSVQRFGLLHL